MTLLLLRACDIAEKWTREVAVNDLSNMIPFLLVIGGDLVQKALAQLSGGIIAPVPFSIGWVPYIFSAMVSIFSGEGAWLTSRLMRDLEKMALDVPADYGLRVTIYRTAGSPGKPEKDWVWHSGLLTILVQLVVASIPLALHGNCIPIIMKLYFCGRFSYLIEVLQTVVYPGQKRR
ncbi:uncharacterized protein BDZ99DRAFT_576587 [Mytilinidion resinicola]|uniref:Uncharacterized protein n=1 Tax=Mytilinidion resinicola TaxID=574789 RepID=A0A6A6Y387_9PEZI|nr:uncharacterized protein BDZ99DRAFT_576587 [Mytilinidion resinicola]KAF2802685.1 hypothetical protein BDZ99DRAFT_576587 [Mytilinidion resinicola]